MKSLNRNVPLLSLALALALSGPPLVVFIGGIVGAELAPAPSWATLPISLMVVGVALFSVPASMIMKRIGRRSGFILAAILATLAALGAAFAIASGSFALFCIATLLIGGNSAFVQQYRFAVAESVPAEHVGKAVSITLLGGVFGGLLGPEIARRTSDWLGYGKYSGSFIGLAVVYLVLVALLWFLKDIRGSTSQVSGDERRLRTIVTQPTYSVAVLAAMVGYGVMSFIMTATPISMHHVYGHSLDATAWVIQSHIIAMYLPSLFTGYLISRLGVTRLMGMGVVAMFTCVLIAFLGPALLSYWGALVLLGIGWNFLFVGGTVLLTRSYHPSERFKAQAFNDFVVFGVQALASLTAGSVIFRTNWIVLNVLNLPVLLGMLAVLILLRHSLSTRQPASV